MLDRRAFLASGLAAAASAYAKPGDKMRFSMSGHEFMTSKPHPETGIKMTAAYGYHGIEPFDNDMPQYLKKPPEVFKALLDEAGIDLCTIGSGGRYDDPATIGDTIKKNVERSKYIAHFGCDHLKVNLNRRSSVEDMTASEAKHLAGHLNEVGKQTLGEAGVKFSPHPHCWTLLERQDELDRLMDLTDPRYVFLTLDTAHATLGGIDPVNALKTYYDRVAHIHFKDCEPKYGTINGWQGPAPTEEEHRRTNLYKLMGTGGVDFPAFMAVLRQRGYARWITMDFSAPRPGEGTVAQHMDSHKKYLVDTLKVTNLRA